MSQRLGESIVALHPDTYETLNLAGCWPVVSKETQEADLFVG